MSLEVIAFLVLTIGLYHIARPFSDLVDRIITNLRGRREGSIQLPSDGIQSRKPFPRFVLAFPSITGLLAQGLMIWTVVHQRYWHSSSQRLIWASVQIAYISIHLDLLLRAFTHPMQLVLISTLTFPISWPLLSLKRTRVTQANPGAAIQTQALIIFVLPFIASLQDWGWYSYYLLHSGRFDIAKISIIAQQVIALAVFVYGTVVRQVCRDGDENEAASTSATPVPASPRAGPSV